MLTEFYLFLWWAGQVLFAMFSAGASVFKTSVQSDTPRKAGGLMSWAASKAVGHWVEASRTARLIG